MTNSPPAAPNRFPVPNATLPFWRTELHDIDVHRTTPELPSECDVVIIGAGYSGASVAYHLVDENPSPPSIVILEAREVCSGATGRNGGHLRPDLIDPGVLKEHGLELALEIARFEKAHLKAIKDVVEKEKIDCDLTFTRAWNVVMNEEVSAEIQKIMTTLSATGNDFFKDAKYIYGDEAAECGVKNAKGCFSYPTAHLWPYKFVASLLAITIAKGVNLQTNTPVTAVSESPDAGGRWTVMTARGEILAKKVIFTTNAYTSALLPQYARVINPRKAICSHIVTPEPQLAPKMVDSYCIRMNSNWDYLIARADGSFIVGGAYDLFDDRLELFHGRVDDDTLIEPAKDYFNTYMQRTFSGWEESGAYVNKIWTGITARTTDHAPHIGAIPSKAGQFIAAGYNGHGMPVIFLTAKGIAQMVLSEIPFEESGIPRLFKTTAERLAV